MSEEALNEVIPLQADEEVTTVQNDQNQPDHDAIAIEENKGEIDDQASKKHQNDNGSQNNNKPLQDNAEVDSYEGDVEFEEEIQANNKTMSDSKNLKNIIKGVCKDYIIKDRLIDK